MAKTHESNIDLLLRWKHQDTDSLGITKDEGPLHIQMAWTDGSGNDQAQDMFRVRTSVLPTADNAYDLAGGVEDAFGDVLTFSTVKLILVQNRATLAGENLRVGGGPFTTGGALLTTIFSGGGDAGCAVLPEGVFLWVAPNTGAAVTSGSADILRVFNDGVGAVEYDLIVIGTRP